MGAASQSPNKNKISHQYIHKNLQFVTSSMQGWRPYMQDSHIAIHPFAQDQDLALFAVFDGHGGPEVSNYIRQYFDYFLKHSQHFKTMNYQKALQQTFMKLDLSMKSNKGKQQLHRLRVEHARVNNANYYEGDTIAGSTANVILITKDLIYCANSGDSRAVAAIKSQQNKYKCEQLSIDHKPTLVGQRARIQKAGGIVNQQGRINNNLNLSRALGDFGFKSNPQLSQTEQMVIALPEIKKIQRNKIKFIIMGCDGIWQRKTNQNMVKWISKKIEKQKNRVKVLESLLNQEIGSNMFDQLGLDNMTAILIQFKQ